MAGALDEYVRVLDALREEWPALFKGYAGPKRTIEEIRFVRARLGLTMTSNAGELLKVATKYLTQEKEPEPVWDRVKATPNLMLDLPSPTEQVGSW